jgi:hypothetical protein
MAETIQPPEPLGYEWQSWRAGVLDSLLDRQRNHPKPGGFYSVARVGGFLEWGKKWKWSPEYGGLPCGYERDIDAPPRRSVLKQTHKPPTELEVLHVTGTFRLGRPPSVQWGSSLHDLRGIVAYPEGWKARKAKRDDAEWWKRKPGRYDRYWDQHLLAVEYERLDRRQWPIPDRRGGEYGIDLIWRKVCKGGGSKGVNFAAASFFLAERLRSPYIPSNSLPVWRPDQGAQRWAALAPDNRPGAWARKHVEAPATALSAERKYLAGPGRSLRSIWGERRGGKLVGATWQRGRPVRGMGDDLDRLALSAAFEAG